MVLLDPLADAAELQPHDAGEHVGRQRIIGDRDDAPEQRRRKHLEQRRPQLDGERLGIGRPAPAAACMMTSVPTLVVSRISVFLKSMRRPVPSSITPLSKTWKKISCTSGWAFSISSSSTTL